MLLTYIWSQDPVRCQSWAQIKVFMSTIGHTPKPPACPNPRNCLLPAEIVFFYSNFMIQINRKLQWFPITYPLYHMLCLLHITHITLPRYTFFTMTNNTLKTKYTIYLGFVPSMHLGMNIIITSYSLLLC